MQKENSVIKNYILSSEKRILEENSPIKISKKDYLLWNLLISLTLKAK